MTWIDRFNTLCCHLAAIPRRELVRRHTVSALDRLDDRLLDDIGVPRHRIAHYAHEVAHKAVPVSPKAGIARRRILARLGFRSRKQGAVSEISIPARPPRSVGIATARAGVPAPTVPGRRAGFWALHPAVQFSEALQQVLVTDRHSPLVPDKRPLAPGAAACAENGGKAGADRTGAGAAELRRQLPS